MTIPTEPAAAAPVSPPAPPVPMQVICYAGIGTHYIVPTGVKVLLAFLAAFHFLVGAPLIVWPLLATATNLIWRAPFDPEQFVAVGIVFAAGAPNVWCGIALLVKRRRETWKAIHAVLAVLCGLELLAFVGGAVMTITYKHAKGWDGLALVFGVVLLIAASVPFWLHALTKLLLLRADVRRAFLFERDEPIRLQRIGTITMMSLYGIALLGGVIAYVVR